MNFNLNNSTIYIGGDFSGKSELINKAKDILKLSKTNLCKGSSNYVPYTNGTYSYRWDDYKYTVEVVGGDLVSESLSIDDVEVLSTTNVNLDFISKKFYDNFINFRADGESVLGKTLSRELHTLREEAPSLLDLSKFVHNKVTVFSTTKEIIHNYNVIPILKRIELREGDKAGYVLDMLRTVIPSVVGFSFRKEYETNVVYVTNVVMADGRKPIINDSEKLHYLISLFSTLYDSPSILIVDDFMSMFRDEMVSDVANYIFNSTSTTLLATTNKHLDTVMGVQHISK